MGGFEVAWMFETFYIKGTRDKNLVGFLKKSAIKAPGQ